MGNQYVTQKRTIRFMDLDKIFSYSTVNDYNNNNNNRLLFLLEMCSGGRNVCECFVGWHKIKWLL